MPALRVFSRENPFAPPTNMAPVMTNVDQFESVFRSAAKEQFVPAEVSIASALIVTDGEGEAAYALAEEIKQFLDVLSNDDENPPPTWDVVPGSEFRSIHDLLTLIESKSPDLVCTHRHLHSSQWRNPVTLGDYVESLTQATNAPVLVVPHPEARRDRAQALADTSTVMAMTSHLTGDNRLVNWALRFTEANGTLFLTHVEDEHVFERYLEAISKIPEINTDIARETIRKQLLKEPTDFIASCAAAIAAQARPIHVQEIVAMGHHLSEYKRLVAEHSVHLLVMNTKDDDQLAMHGLAYPLAVELHDVPILML